MISLINKIKYVYFILENNIYDMLDEIRNLHFLLQNERNFKIFIIILILIVTLIIIRIKQKYNITNKDQNFNKYLIDFKKSKKKLINLNKKLIENKNKYENNYKIRIIIKKYINFIIIIFLIIGYIFINQTKDNDINYYFLYFLIFMILFINLFFTLLNTINIKTIKRLESKVKIIKNNEKICIKTFLDRIDNDFKNDLKKEIFKNYDLILEGDYKEDGEFNDLYKKYLKQKIQLKTQTEYNIAFKKFYEELSDYNWCDICYKDINKEKENNISKSNKCNCISSYIKFCSKLYKDLDNKIKKIENKYFITIN